MISSFLFLAIACSAALALLLDSLREANELVEHPRWYNALSHNCTTTIRHQLQAPSVPRIRGTGAFSPTGASTRCSTSAARSTPACPSPHCARAATSPRRRRRRAPIPSSRAASARGCPGCGKASISETPAIDSPVLRVSPERGEVAESGRMRLTRNQEYPQGYRGFESLPLRHVIASSCRPKGTANIPTEAPRKPAHAGADLRRRG